MAPRRAVAEFAYSLSPEIRRAISGWSIEWPRQASPLIISTPPPWLVVAGKLLRRGSIVPFGPELEQKLRPLLGDIDGITETDWVGAASLVAALAPSPASRQGSFDSDAERGFLEDVVRRVSPKALLGFWKRQVAIGSLTGSTSHLDSSQRVDFLFCHPFRTPLVVEIDGPQHAQQGDIDARRDALLSQFGVDVLRISTREIAHGDGPAIGRLAQILASVQVVDVRQLPVAARWLLAGRRVHQIQQVIVEAFEKGLLPPAGDAVAVTVLPDHLMGDISVAESIIGATVNDLNELLREVAGCQNSGPPPAVRLCDLPHSTVALNFGDQDGGARLELAVRDSYFPASPELESPRTRPFVAAHSDRHCCEQLLRRVFGYESFREGQFEAVERALRGMDSLVLLPTGSGKSVAFQLASFLKPGVGVVVDPILSLIEDQIENLRVHGIDRVDRIAGTQTPQEREAVLALLSRTQYWLCYVAPERFQSDPFRDSLRGLTTNTPVSLVAIDEAHCVSEWGHDFRPAYLNLARAAREHCASAGQAPPLMGLTGTASRSVLKDVQRELGITDVDAVIVPRSFDRKELSFEAIPCRSDEKPPRLKSLLRRFHTQFGEHPTEFFKARGSATCSGLVFCPWVGGDHGVIEVGRMLASDLAIGVPVYGSKRPKGTPKDRWETQLRRTAEGFKRNQFALMTCTKAFGMGIDKPNIRYTVHYNIPPSIEAFYQEAGRAGRDGRAAHCVILFSDDFPARTVKILDPSRTGLTDLRAAVDDASYEKGDDITRALFFHSRAFRGAEGDRQTLSDVVKRIGPLNRIGKATLEFSPATDGAGEHDEKAESRKVREKALLRLVVTGVVSDYTIDYNQDEFHIRLAGADQSAVVEHLYRYVAAYQRQRAVKAVEDVRKFWSLPFDDFVLAACGHLIDFVYEVIERGRRHALSEVLRVCSNATDGDSIRSEILKYLERSRFADNIDELLGAEHAGIYLVPPVVEEIRSFLDAAELRGECARELESYPDQPSLRLLRAVAEALSQKADAQVVEQNTRAAIVDGVVKYGLPLHALLEAVAAIADTLTESRPLLARLVLQAAVSGSSDRREATRYLLARVRPALFGPLIAVLVGGLADAVRELDRR